MLVPLRGIALQVGICINGIVMCHQRVEEDRRRFRWSVLGAAFAAIGVDAGVLNRIARLERNANDDLFPKHLPEGVLDCISQELDLSRSLFRIRRHEFRKTQKRDAKHQKTCHAKKSFRDTQHVIAIGIL